MFRKIILVIFCCSIAGLVVCGSLVLSKNLANNFASVISQVFPGISQPPTPLSSSSEPISSPAVVQETAAVKDIAQETAAVKEIKEITRLVQIEPAPPSQSAVEQVAQQISQSSYAALLDYATLADLNSLESRLLTLIGHSQNSSQNYTNQVIYAFAPTQKIDNLGIVTISQATVANDLTLGGNLSTAGNLSVSGTQSFTGNANFSGNVGIGTTPNNLLSVYQLIDFNNTDYNTKLGYQAGLNIVSGAQYNTFIGYQAGMASSTASTNAALRNTAVGYQALYSNTTGYYNSAMGYKALYYNTVGYDNSAIGFYALRYNTTGYYNSAMGMDALYSNTTGISNSATGYTALYLNTTGAYNSATGAYSLYYNTTGNANSAMGYYTLFYNNSVASTTAVGYQAARGTAAYSNQGGVYLGYQAGYSAKTGSDYNTLLGYQAGYGITTGSYNIIIGQNVEAASTTASQQLNIGNLIYGTGLYNGSTVSSAPVIGNVGIGTSTPNQLLTVVGTRPSIKLSDYSAGQNLKTWLFSSMGGNLYIGTSTDAYATSTPAALTILNNGNVGISSTSPSQQFSIGGLAYIGGVGTSTIESNLYVMGTLRAARSYVGDLVFGNNFLFTESEPAASPQFLILKNQRGEDILSVDENGNLRIKGEIISLVPNSQFSIFDSILDWFKDKIMWIKELIAEKITTKTVRTEKIEMVDKATGDIYCTWVENGEWQKIKGECATEATTTTEATPTPTMSESPSPSPSESLLPTESPSPSPTPNESSPSPSELPSESPPPAQ